jgi:hypothetical protein
LTDDWSPTERSFPAMASVANEAIRRHEERHHRKNGERTAMSEYACPNGHDFPRAVAVACEQCGANVLCEPMAAGMRLNELLESAEHEVTRLRDDLDRERAARRAVDQALADAIAERDRLARTRE